MSHTTASSNIFTALYVTFECKCENLPEGKAHSEKAI